jgi:hypothetical protein
LGANGDKNETSLHHLPLLATPGILFLSIMRFPKLGSLRRRSIDTPEEKRDDVAFTKTEGSLEVPDVVPSPRSTDTWDINQTGLAAWKDPTNFAAEFDRLSFLHSLSVKTPSEQRFDAITK